MRDLPVEQVSIGGVMYPYENYFHRGPNPAPGLQTAAYKDPARSHAPIAAPIPCYTLQDASNPAFQRIPQFIAPIPEKELPYIPVYAPSQFIGTPALTYQTGWKQGFVPQDNQRLPLNASSPFLQLSQPIKYDKIEAVSETKRRKLMIFKAPKAH